MTDDQTLESLRVMNTVKSELVDQGTSFSRYYVSFPNCCPSRASYLTGQYSHNNGVEDNVAPLGGAAKLRADETLPVWLQRAGYTTAHVGKYLNTWGEDGNISPPPGWSTWYGLIDPSTYSYYRYSVSDNGQRKDFGDAETDYQTDVLGQRVVDFVRNQPTGGKPWFLSFTPLAPHAEAPETGGQGPQEGSGTEFKWAFPKPAPRHERSLVAKAPRGPAFNPDDVSGLPEELRNQPKLSDGLEKLIDQGYQLELEALQAVDDWVGKIITTLKDTKQLDNTVILFTSDNGFFHGEHRLAFKKYYLYEPAVHVPLIIRGGPFGKKKQATQVVGNVDLAPTILALAGAAPAANWNFDGIDIAPLAKDPKAGTDRGYLVENRSGRGSTKGVVTERYKLLVHHTGEEEMYDLDKDPDELQNIAADAGAASLKKELRRRLDVLKGCKGAPCLGRK